MKLKAITVTSLLACMAFTAHAQSSATNPITQAMMEVYAQELMADPHNYEILFRRAGEYYNHDQYLRALTDIEEAIRYTPETEVDLLFQEHLLKANIYIQLKRPEDALIEFTHASEIDPTSLTVLMLRGNTYLSLGRLNEAKADYSKLLRNDSRNLDALFGLSRIAVKENNLGMAIEYADRAVSFSPSGSSAYLERADVRRLMGNNNGAVDDLISALSVDTKSGLPIQRLVEMSNRDYNAVIAGLTNAMQQAPAVGMYPYLRATIAQAHYHFKAAIDDYNHILDENLYNYHGIYGSLAECYFGLGKYEQALTEINQALSMTADNGQYYVVRARIRRAMGDDKKALESATEGLNKLPNSCKAMVEKALCEISEKEYQNASDLLGTAIMDEPNTAMPFLLRARLLQENLREPAAAKALWERMLDLDYPDTALQSLRGFALIKLDRKADAISWMESIMSNVTDVDGSIHYTAACLFSQIGRVERAIDCMERSLELGYSDYYNWTRANDTSVSIAPLRDNPRFKALLQRYDYLFN